jgi:tetratricopeptide (TPR) repeat protein
MASVFLSYDRDDGDRARHFARALEKAGHEVWWDLHVRGGAQFSKVIEEALKAADAVVVLWSANSIESAWVRDEAAAGRDTARLVPVTIDGTSAPLGFRQFQTIDLSRWRGRGAPAELRTLFGDIEAVAGSSGDAPRLQPQRPSRQQKSGMLGARRLLVAAIALCVLLAGGLVYWLISSRSLGPPTVAVAAADGKPASQQMARGLLVDLGNLQSVKSGSMTLVNALGDSSPSDLQFQVADTTSGTAPSATLALLNVKDQGVIWSSDFEQPSGKASDLNQQLAFTAGKVLGCALDGLSGSGHRLAPQTLKAYLNACAQLSDLASGDPRPVIPMLRQVTRDSPHFAPAWGKLLLAQATVSDLNFTNGKPDETARAELRGLIAEARKLSPGIAEADLAETELLPPTAFAQQLALADRAVRRSPDDPVTLSSRGSMLLGVGRMAEAVDDVGRASQMDPLSPALSAQYMATLAFAGMQEPARKQLAELEKLWPATTSTEQARWLYYFRYGDPKVALSMSRSQGGTAGIQYLLEARIDPSPANVARLVKFMNARRDKLAGNAGPDRLTYYTVAMGAFHQHDELFDTLMHWPKPDELALASAAYFRPELHEFRKEPRFLQVMKRARLLDYWRTSGHWPDFCFEADMPYDCKTEARKLG